MACGLDSLLQTTLSGECSVAIPSTLNILLGLFLKLCFVSKDDNSLKYSVYRAARQYNVPESTLRDRTRGNVDIEANVSQDTIFTKDGEKDFVSHMTYMASIEIEKNIYCIKFSALFIP
jgi:hypothetical protein